MKICKMITWGIRIKSLSPTKKKQHKKTSPKPANTLCISQFRQMRTINFRGIVHMLAVTHYNNLERTARGWQN